MQDPLIAINCKGDGLNNRRRSPNAGGECCVKLPDGTFSADALHEQLVAGVDDSDIRAKTRRLLIESGLPPHQVNMLFRDLLDGADEGA